MPEIVITEFMDEAAIEASFAGRNVLYDPKLVDDPARLAAALREARALDLLVVGGGINGAGIARDAAGRGLAVVLCEQDDLAQHTSSASTKLIHGGLRYLEHYEFALVGRR
jgi:glycine/D-amino acid oxidase-like deaminating enzyme